MSENEYKEDIVEETEEEDEDQDDTSSDDDSSDDDSTTIDWEAKFKEESGKRKRAETKLSKMSDPTKKSNSSKSDELGYAEKAYLVANGIKGADEMNIVKGLMKKTGASLDEILEDDYFQSKLNSHRDLKRTEAATPSGSKRAGQSSSNTVEYWIAKGELPPASERELRQKVVNARIKSESNTDVFSKNAIVK